MTDYSERAQTQASAAAIQLYGLSFWVAYTANFLLVAANTLTFRFADFVVSLGGTATTTGLILGVGTGVSALVRLWMGRVVDQTGPRYMWLASAVALTASCVALVPLHSLGPMIFIIRIVYACGIAGVFSCSVIHICTDVPLKRRAELIGTLGTSGFIGSIVGPQVGDFIFNSAWLHAHRFEVMFGISAFMDLLYLVLVAYLTKGLIRPARHEPPPLVQVLRHFWPGAVVGVAMMMGMALTIPAMFLTLFRDARGLEGIGKFFWFYAPTAIIMRLAGRRWPERIGQRSGALFGLVALAASMLLYLDVQTEWDLVWTALAAGTGQALLFPAVTTLGAASFPERYRATGTTLIMSFVDVGSLGGAPILGWMIDRFGFERMFVFAAILIAAVALIFSVETVVRMRRTADVQWAIKPEFEEQPLNP